MLLPSGNPFKCHEEVLYFQLLIPPKRFDIFPQTGGCSEGLGAFRFFFKQPNLSILSLMGRKTSKVESPLHTVAGIQRYVYWKSWEQAMQSEFKGHMKTGTFSMVGRVPEGRKPVGSRWRFDFKTDKEEKITKFKTRLVAEGFTRIRNVDYTHSSSPCPSSTFMKLVLAVADERGLLLYHFDVVQAYIRASPVEEVYMKRPGGCGKKSKKTAKLERAICSLK